MMNFDKPKFITFEGGEGSGKSTQSKMLYEFLVSKRIKAIHTREVGGTIEAEKIRHLLLYAELMPMSELLLVMAARHEHLNKVIVPALLDGFWVICDRFIDSTAAYQSGESGLTIEEIFELHRNLMAVDSASEHYGSEEAMPDQILNQTNEFKRRSGIMPDITFFMDVLPEIGLERASTRGDANKFEAKNMVFHKKIYGRFKSIAAMHNERVFPINCMNREVAEIHALVIDRIFH